MSDDEKAGIKVTDRRMFTETGELREEFESVEPSTSPETERAPSEPAQRKAEPEPQPEPPMEQAEPSSGSQAESPGSDGPATAEPSAASEGVAASEAEMPPGYAAGARQPQFFDLVAMLAEPAALFLGDASIPGQEPMEDLERARMHIDLLGLLESKCAGNLTEQESLVLSDLVYRLRLRYVEKKG